MEMMKASSENQQQQKQQVQDFEREEVRGRSFHVLAVDDSHIERKILEKLLTVSSYQVTSVESGDKALEYLGLLDSPASCEPQGNGMRVNLIMTDYSMPGMSGYDLLKRVKGSSWRDVPVIVMSSENVPSRIHMCLEEGAEEFLLKPVRLSDLMKLQDYVARSATCRCCVDDSNADDSEIGIGGESCDNIEETIVERKILL